MRQLPHRVRIVAVGIVLACFAGVAAADYITFGNGWGSKWDNPVHGNPATITWGFMPDGTTVHPSRAIAAEVVGGSNITALRSSIDAQYGAGAFNAALARAFHTWELVAGVHFVGPVADPGLQIGAPGATTPDIRIGAFMPLAGAGFNYVGAVGFGPPGNDIDYPDPFAGDVMFNLASTFRIFPGTEGAAFNNFGNDLEGLFLHELGHAAIGIGHPNAGVSEVMYVGAGCCTTINREPSPDDIKGARIVYGPSSTPACANGLDDDADGKRDFPTDPGCLSATDDIEAPECTDGVDNDGDGKIDYGPGPTNDPGCRNNLEMSVEKPACNDGLDNDGDGKIDFGTGPTNDAQCPAAWGTSENPPPPASCGLLGIEVLVAAAAANGLKRLRRRSARRD